ncbi:peptide transporter [Shewanella algae]|jgi:chromosome partitioning protein|uniref:ParA protein n=1 Tax=Vibrio phage VP882 TaxID=2913982 RepID=A2I303_9CAUD|nr:MULTISPECIES: ParA family partition ATPase [Gammaproteobacteria]YP_001039864.1 ParA-like partition protein [Vibrio phage VP882]EAZ2875428.1 peptide transporter [Salmonella enterica]ABM73417.1 parA protein [Vibrio phage VP882]EBK6743095.1 peptide transporter [Salmonella enterica]EBM1056859.1 peptide transporter [Salmonella enterica]ELN1085005.1 AAA family ATPase [Salmonella enterica]
MPKVIAVLNQKGGSGKTTISTNVASWLHSQGESTLLVDLDPQGSASDWADAREGDELCPVVRMGKSISRDLPKIARDYDWVVIDGAPQVSELAAAAVRAADVVLIPVQPSPYDIWACSDLVELLKARQEVTDGHPRGAFVISRAIKNTRLSGEVMQALEGYELPIFANGTTQKVDYANTAKWGGSVVDLEDEHKARFEIKMLVKELKEFANA